MSCLYRSPAKSWILSQRIPHRSPIATKTSPTIARKLYPGVLDLRHSNIQDRHYWNNWLFAWCIPISELENSPGGWHYQGNPTEDTCIRTYLLQIRQKQLNNLFSPSVIFLVTQFHAFFIIIKATNSSVFSIRELQGLSGFVSIWAVAMIRRNWFSDGKHRLIFIEY